MADNQKKISSIVPRRGSKKKVAAMIRQESFKDAYPEKETKQPTDAEKDAFKKTEEEVKPADVTPKAVENNEDAVNQVVNESLVERTSPPSIEPLDRGEKDSGTATRKAKKGKNKYEYDYTTIGVDSTTALAVQIASKMLQEKQNEFTKTAIRNHLNNLIKKGKLYDLPQFNI